MGQTLRICVLGMSVKRPPGAGVGTEVAAGTKAGPLAAVCVCCAWLVGGARKQGRKKK
jgi:hypothetical protein